MKFLFEEGFLVKKVFATVIALTLVVIGGSYLWAQENASADFTNEQIVDFYVEIAFGAEIIFSGTLFSEDQVAKRESSKIVNIVPLPQPSVPLAEAFTIIRKIAIEMQAFSGGLRLLTYDENNITRFLSRDRSALLASFQDSVIVFVGSRKELENLIEKAANNNPEIGYAYQSLNIAVNAGKPLCMGVVGANKGDYQTLAMAAAWVEYGPQLEECLYEELMQVFGIANDFPAGTPSMFNDDGVFNRPTPLDWTLWRIHTDPRIVAGMNEEEVRIVAMEILTEIGE